MRLSNRRSASPNFVKNEQFCRHYHSVGSALLAYEREAPVLLRVLHERAMFNLKVALSFLHDSVLDSYLEDLLDLSVSDTDLFIKSQGFSLRRVLIIVPIIGLLIASWLGFYMSMQDYSYTLCVLVTVVLCIPFALLWEWVPSSSNRRLFFARVIAAELSGRRGDRGTRVRETAVNVKAPMLPSPT